MKANRKQTGVELTASKQEWNNHMQTRCSCVPGFITYRLPLTTVIMGIQWQVYFFFKKIISGQLFYMYIMQRLGTRPRIIVTKLLLGQKGYSYIFNFPYICSAFNKIWHLLELLRVFRRQFETISHVLNEQGTGYEHIFSSLQTFNIN